MTTKISEIQKATEKKPAQKAFVPHPELGESGDVNALPQEGRQESKKSKTGKSSPEKKD